MQNYWLLRATELENDQNWLYGLLVWDELQSLSHAVRYICYRKSLQFYYTPCLRNVRTLWWIFIYKLDQRYFFYNPLNSKQLKFSKQHIYNPKNYNKYYHASEMKFYKQLTGNCVYADDSMMCVDFDPKQ